jgi:hypothetical protein
MLHTQKHAAAFHQVRAIETTEQSMIILSVSEKFPKKPTEICTAARKGRCDSPDPAATPPDDAGSVRQDAKVEFVTSQVLTSAWIAT